MSDHIEFKVVGAAMKVSLPAGMFAIEQQREGCLLNFSGTKYKVEESYEQVTARIQDLRQG